MPRVSVILPVYNTEKYVADCVDSILNQTYKDFEFIIINDASTDNTLAVLQSFKDSRIRIINNSTNQGISRNANLGLDEAQGQFLARIDADDVAHLSRLEEQVKYLDNNPSIDLCGTWVQLIGSENSLIRTAVDHEYIKAGLLFLNVIFNPSIMYRKDSFTNNNLRYDESYRIEDYPLWIDAIDKIQFANMPNVLQKYRMHDTNISVFQEGNRNSLNDFHHRIYKKVFEKFNIDYTNDDLNVHRKIGLRTIELSSQNELATYLNWLEKIIKTNIITGYYSKDALNFEVIDRLILLYRKSKGLNKITVLRTLMKLFKVKDCFKFISDKNKLNKYSIKKF